MKNSLLVLFDGNALVHRAFHAMPPLTVPRTGEMVGAVYGFASMLLKVINDLQPSCVAVAFDISRKTFRLDLYSAYKANREKTPEELVNQMKRVRQVVDTFNVPIYQLENYEADDVLGTLSRQAVGEGIDVVIVTGDADAMQLVSPGIKVLYPKPRKSFGDTMLYDEAAVLEKYGVKPENIADLKALVGDTSDNIPGVKGIGDVTAVKLIKQFGAIEQIYQHIEEVTPPRVRDILKTGQEIARRSKVLATIVCNAPVLLNLDKCQVDRYDRDKVKDLFRELEFYSLIDKLPGTETTAPEMIQTGQMPQPVQLMKQDYRLATTPEVFKELLNKLDTATDMVVEIVGTSTNPISAQLLGIAISISPGEAWYVPLGHAGLLVEQLPADKVLADLKPYFEKPGLPKIVYDGKYALTMLAERGISLNNLNFDVMIAAHLLGDKSVELKNIALARLGVELQTLSSLTGTGAKAVPPPNLPPERVSDYACAGVDVTGQLARLQETDLKRDNLWQLFSEVEMPLVGVLSSMERRGVLLNVPVLEELSVRLETQLQKLEKDIYGWVGHEFNINSPQQLSEILFQDLHLPASKKTKSGYSTGAEVLEALRGVHPVIELLLEYRQLTKLKSTYIDALPGLINTKTGRLHTSFNQARTSTGRLSSSDPNLQNIPIRSELATEIRRAFVAPPGMLLMGADYSQIDLRSLAHLSRDKTLIETFNKNEDIHSATAARLYNVPLNEVKPEMRRDAKTINFGIIYGMSQYGLEQATDFSRAEAGKFITAYFEKYPGVREYIEMTREQVRKTGYVQTILGRRRYVPEINAVNRIVREAAERMAVNMPVQGTSADIIKVAMVNLEKEIPKRGLKSRMLLQVHDELIFEVPDEELEIMKQIVPDIMTNSLKLIVPLKVDIKTGRNWGEMEK